MSHIETFEYEESDLPNGRLGMWWFLASEITIFGSAVAAFVLYRFRFPEWLEYGKQTMTAAGFINTLILLTSSYTVVLAHQASEKNKANEAKRYLLITLGLGAVFLGIKAFEYTHKFKAGIFPTENLFWGFYFFLTGLHALHVIIGLVIMACFAAKIKSQLHRVEYLGLYWHLVDIVWIFLFPLLYLGG